MSASVLACLQRSHMISYHTVCISSYFSRFLSFSICLSSASARRFSCQLFGEIRSDNVIICDNRDMTYQYIYISIYLSQIVTTCLIRKPSFPQILHGWFSKILEGSLRTTQLSAQRSGQEPWPVHRRQKQGFAPVCWKMRSAFMCVPFGSSQLHMMENVRLYMRMYGHVWAFQCVIMRFRFVVFCRSQWFSNVLKGHLRARLKNSLPWRPRPAAVHVKVLLWFCSSSV